MEIDSGLRCLGNLRGTRLYRWLVQWFGSQGRYRVVCKRDKGVGREGKYTLKVSPGEINGRQEGYIH